MSDIVPDDYRFSLKVVGPYCTTPVLVRRVMIRSAIGLSSTRFMMIVPLGHSSILPLNMVGCLLCQIIVFFNLKCTLNILSSLQQAFVNNFQMSKTEYVLRMYANEPITN
jgi:hypothetical protein